MFAGKKSAQIREILISESAWEEMTCLFAPSHMLGLKCIHDIVVNAMEYLHIDVPVALHLDHGTTQEACEAAIAAGFSSIMFDGSHLPFRENLAITRHLVTLAHSKGISVEAELGTIAGSEDGIVNSGSHLRRSAGVLHPGDRNPGGLPRRRAGLHPWSV